MFYTLLYIQNDGFAFLFVHSMYVRWTQQEKRESNSSYAYFNDKWIVIRKLFYICFTLLTVQ